MEPTTSAAILAGSIISIVGLGIWLIQRSVTKNDKFQSNRDSNQDEDIANLRDKLITLEAELGELRGHVDTLEKFKMSESQTRSLVSEIIEPLKEYQKETSSKMDRLIDIVTELKVITEAQKIARRREDYEDNHS